MGPKVVNEDVEMPVGMRRITPIPVMSFAEAKWLRTSKGGIFPDGKARPSAREDGLQGEIASRASASAYERGEDVAYRGKGASSLIKINLGHSYFHKLWRSALFAYRAPA